MTPSDGKTKRLKDKDQKEKSLCLDTSLKAPASCRPQISKDAEWIWPAGQSTNEAYCRGRLGDYGNVLYCAVNDNVKY